MPDLTENAVALAPHYTALGMHLNAEAAYAGAGVPMPVAAIVQMIEDTKARKPNGFRSLAEVWKVVERSVALGAIVPPDSYHVLAVMLCEHHDVIFRDHEATAREAWKRSERSEEERRETMREIAFGLIPYSFGFGWGVELLELIGDTHVPLGILKKALDNRRGTCGGSYGYNELSYLTRAKFRFPRACWRYLVKNQIRVGVSNVLEFAIACEYAGLSVEEVNVLLEAWRPSVDWANHMFPKLRERGYAPSNEAMAEIVWRGIIHRSHLPWEPDVRKLCGLASIPFPADRLAEKIRQDLKDGRKIHDILTDIKLWPSAPQDLVVEVLRYCPSLPLGTLLDGHRQALGKCIMLAMARKVTPEVIESCVPTTQLVRAGDTLLESYDSVMRDKHEEGWRASEATPYREAIILCYRLARSPDGFGRLIQVMVGRGVDPAPAMRALMELRSAA